MADLLSLRVPDNKEWLAVKRAIDQISYALKDHGLFVTIDLDGNLGVDKLPAEFPIKDERISDNLRRRIHEGYRTGKPVSGIRMTHDDARKFARELMEYQMHPAARSELELYEGLVTGGFKFMDVPLHVIG